MPTTPHIAIIGGGFSGTLVAVQLLRQATGPTRITLIERAPGIGRGVAYRTECADNLLNVPAGRMGAFPEDPGHFLRWLQERVGRTGYPKTVSASDYVPRQLYGDYVFQVLNEARTHAAPEVKIELVYGEAIDVEEQPAGGRIHLADGRQIEAHQVVLALGNLPGEYPIKQPLSFYKGRRYVHIPWNTDALERIRPDDEVLIVGAGLTSFDIILQLRAQNHRGKITAISRRGLLPQTHATIRPYRDFLAGEELPRSVLQALRRVRREIKEATATGDDWRAVVDALRPHTQALWQGWSWNERARFLRHVRPFWETVRHRLAPEAVAKIEALRQAGKVEFIAGRLHALAETADAAEVVYRRRRDGQLVTLRVGKVINCTGPRSDYSKYQHPLFINLLSRRLIDHDPLALGVTATPLGEVFRYRGPVVGWLYTLGATLKAVLWECTAVPELREQAKRLAAHLLTRTVPEPTSRYLEYARTVRARIREITTQEIERATLRPDTVLVDVREADEWATGHAAGAVHISRGILESEIEERVPNLDTPVVLYCAGGNRSAFAAENLQEMGYRNVVSLAGGFRAWQRAQLPVVLPQPVRSRD